MKKFKTCIIFLLLIFAITLNGHSQNVTAHRQPVSVKTVPKPITTNFNKQYPHVLLLGWYSTHLTYWQNDHSSDWYKGWYGQRKIVAYTYLNPNYYEVEFMDHPGETSRAIYNLYGQWFETRTKINGLNTSIRESLKASKYYGWKISSTMEKIESPMWPIEIYRFHVSKGLKSHTIRMDEEGNFIQIKVLNN